MVFSDYQTSLGRDQYWKLSVAEFAPTNRVSDDVLLAADPMVERM